jgi:NTE family protein
MTPGSPRPATTVAGATVGLLLPGGGARAAYQVGVLKAIAEILPHAPNPFPIVVGTSAGAVSAAVIASEAFRWQYAVTALEAVWANFHVHHVFRADALSMLRSGFHWALSLGSGGLLLPPPRALFDNSPLRHLLQRRINWRHLQRSIEGGHLSALALCATSYTSATSVAFFQGAPGLTEWSRQQRLGRRCALQLDHLMASLGVPLLFPPVQIGAEYYGDGAQRQLWPLSPAIHLGANRLVVIGVRAEQGGGVSGRMQVAQPPTPGQLFGYMLDTLFMDQIYANIEHVVRLNHIIQTAPQAIPEMQKVATLVIAPSVDLGQIALEHVRSLPRPLRVLLRVMGARGRAGAQLASYVMFESTYTRELIGLGYADGLRRRTELLEFLGGDALSQTTVLPGLRRERRLRQEKGAELQQRRNTDAVGEGRKDHAGH